MGKMAAVVQSVPDDPKYLFSEASLVEPSFLSDKMVIIYGSLCGFFGPMIHNYSRRRPALSGVPFIITSTIAATAVSYWYQKRSNRYWADNDALIRDYIALHPEDFPAKERIVIGDMLKPWVPCR